MKSNFVNWWNVVGISPVKLLKLRSLQECSKMKTNVKSENEMLSVKQVMKNTMSHCVLMWLFITNGVS